MPCQHDGMVKIGQHYHTEIAGRTVWAIWDQFSEALCKEIFFFSFSSIEKRCTDKRVKDKGGYATSTIYQSSETVK